MSEMFSCLSEFDKPSVSDAMSMRVALCVKYSLHSRTCLQVSSLNENNESFSLPEWIRVKENHITPLQNELSFI